MAEEAEHEGENLPGAATSEAGTAWPSPPAAVATAGKPKDLATLGEAVKDAARVSAGL